MKAWKRIHITKKRAACGVLGLLLLDDSHRRLAASGKLGLTADDFFTALGKRAYGDICRMEESDHGFDFSMLGEDFSADEMGRLSQTARAALGKRNGCSDRRDGCTAR